MNQSAQVVIAGAGISGLCTAWYLKRAGVGVRVLEAKNRVGGNIQTIKEGNCLWELGPNSLQARDQTLLALVSELGLEPEVVLSSPCAHRRFIVRNAALRCLPSSPLKALGSKALSLRGKLRALAELFVAKGSDPDESVYSFVSRRLGREVADYLVDPFVRGIYAGTPQDLLVRMAFPKLYALEQEYGSLLGAAFKRSRKSKAEHEIGNRAQGNLKPSKLQLFSFKNGLETLVQKLQSDLSQEITLNSALVGLEKNPAGQFRLRLSSANGDAWLETENLILALPAYVSAEIMGRSLFSSENSERPIISNLRSIQYPPLAIVYSAFKSSDIEHALDGFGFLAPACEKRFVLGSLWTSSFFENRAPNGYAAITSMVGGSSNPHRVFLSDEELISSVLLDLKHLIGIRAEPIFTKVHRWDKTIPQYNGNQEQALKSIERLETGNPGLHVIGNFRGGVSIGACVEQSRRTAKKILGALSAASPERFVNLSVSQG